MFTKAEKAHLEKNYASREYVRGYRDARFDFFKQEIKEEFVTREEFNKAMDRVYTALDIIIGEIKAIREEMAAFSFRSLEQTSQLENHESRLVRLENPTAVTL